MKRSLGRGLEALLGAPATSPADLPVDKIVPNRYQPRTPITEADLADLVASVRTAGILQPVLVRAKGDQYELIAGERRWRAAMAAGLATVPAVVRDVDDRGALALALVENIQREDLNAIERARAFDRLQREFGMTQEEVSVAVGRSRASVANTLRLLELPEAVQELVSRGTLSEGHARALLGLPPAEREAAALRAVAQRLSVRDIERQVRERRASPGRRDPHVEKLEQYLREHFGTRVDLVCWREGGRIIIHYYSTEHLEQLVEKLIGDIPSL